MKTCNKCQVNKEESEFGWRNKSKGKIQAYCRDCKKEIDKEFYKLNLTGRSERIRINSLDQIRRAKEFVNDFKKSGQCRKCGDKRYYVLDFHHTRDKEGTISKMVQQGCSIKKLKGEIDKCELLCANCHREHHHLTGDKANLVKASV